MFVVVGTDSHREVATLAVGPFEERMEANACCADLQRATSGRYVVLSLHTPVDGAWKEQT